jgi:hypothetical protein
MLAILPTIVSVVKLANNRDIDAPPGFAQMSGSTKASEQ